MVAQLPGDAGTRWRSDLWLLNPAGSSQRALLEYRGDDGSDPVRAQVAVPAGELLALDEVVADRLGAGEAT